MELIETSFSILTKRTIIGKQYDKGNLLYFLGLTRPYLTFQGIRRLFSKEYQEFKFWAWCPHVKKQHALQSVHLKIYIINPYASL